MSDQELPFYTQVAILDRYIQRIDPEKDREIIEVILDVLRNKPELRQYFFSNRPSYVWAKILWDNHFFDSPPEPQSAGDGLIRLIPWDVQYFLNSVAQKVPDIVLKHAHSIESNGNYTSTAILALSNLEASQAVKAVNRVIEWLNNPNIAGEILEEVYDYLVALIQGGEFDAGLSLFREYTKPVLTSEFGTIASRSGTRGPVVTLFDNALSSEYHKVNVFSELTKLNPQEIANIFFEHLGVALKMEEEQLKESPDYTSEVDFELTSWWRVAVEETGQDTSDTAKEKLLKKLLVVLEFWSEKDFDEFQTFLMQILNEKRSICYRVGLYLLQKFAGRLPSTVQKELLKFENLDNTEIHHEFFLLLANGYQFLNDENQGQLLKYILYGPPEEKLNLYRDYFLSSSWEKNITLDEFIEGRRNLWIRDRLWMIRSHLYGESLEQLKTLLEKYGRPDHPTFTSWMSEAGFEEVAIPMPEDDLEKFTPQQLIEYVTKWKPEPNKGSIFEERNYEGLGQVIANVIYQNTNRYSATIAKIAKIRPVIATEILARFEKAETIRSEQWEILFLLCDELLGDENIRTNMDRTFGDNWLSARLTIVRLISTGFGNTKHKIPLSQLSRVRDILFILFDDPDPENEPVPNLEKSPGMDDPLTVSLNCIRPLAVRALIDYAIFRVNDNVPGDRLEENVKVNLERKLAQPDMNNKSVWSVFGRYFPALHWLDSEWTEKNIDTIFPKVQDGETLWLFQSAWDGYITNRHWYTNLSDLLIEKYFTAIETISRGFITRREIIINFAIHLVWDYLEKDYAEDFPNTNRIPLIVFFRKARPEDRAKGAKGFFRIFSSNRSDITKFWPKTRLFIEWRVREAISSNHISDFDEEIRDFAEIIQFAPDAENINTLWPLLEGMLPHIGNIEHRDRGWDSVEKYIAKEVINNPLPCIQLYHRMREFRIGRLQWRKESNEARKIIETGANKIESRRETLALIDFLARLGNRAYDDIYFKYSK